jgi:hypothetical protein
MNWLLYYYSYILKSLRRVFSNLMHIFLVFHNFLSRSAEFQLALYNGNLINHAKLRYIKRRILIKKDKKE